MSSFSLDESVDPGAEAEYVDFFEFDEEDFAAIGLSPSEPTAAKPGSEEKVVMLSARYAVGIPLWHTGDCYDHGPGSVGDLVVNDHYGVTPQ